MAALGGLPDGLAFGTHVSLLDLAGLAATTPVLAFRALTPGGRS